MIPLRPWTIPKPETEVIFFLPFTLTFHSFDETINTNSKTTEKKNEHKGKSHQTNLITVIKYTIYSDIVHFCP